MSTIMGNPKQRRKPSSRAEPTAEDVFDAIHSVMHRYMAQQYRLHRDSAHELTHLEGRVLGYFARHPGATQRDLAEHSGRDKGQLARLIAGLRKRKLLEGRRDATDRRSRCLQLTEEGHTVQRMLQRPARRAYERAVTGLSDSERRQLVALLEKIHNNLTGCD